MKAKPPQAQVQPGPLRRNRIERCSLRVPLRGFVPRRMAHQTAREIFKTGN